MNEPHTPPGGGDGDDDGNRERKGEGERDKYEDRNETRDGKDRKTGKTGRDGKRNGKGNGDGDRERAEEPVPEGGGLQQGSGEPRFDHAVLKSLLGAWALAACSAEETSAVESHLTDCAACADEALRLRDAVGLLHPEDSLDLDPTLRSRVLHGCLVRRPARLPVPEWAVPYDAETARLDALLGDMAEAEWRAPVWLRWFDGRQQAARETNVAGVIAHLLAVDGLVARALGLPDPTAPDPFASDPAAPDPFASDSSAPNPLGPEQFAPEHFSSERSAYDETAYAGASYGTSGEDAQAPHRQDAGRGERGSQGGAAGERCSGTDPRTGNRRHMDGMDGVDGMEAHAPRTRERWRDQSHAVVRTASFAGNGVAGLDVGHGTSALPLRDAMLDRAFECWVHAEDIAQAVDYPYAMPEGPHLHLMVDLAARMLPGTLAWRRRTGLSTPARRLTAAGAHGRALHLEVEGVGGGDWYIPLDSPAAAASAEDAVAHVALDGHEFCRLAAGRVPPQDAAAGQDGDREAVRDVLYAAASLSRL